LLTLLLGLHLLLQRNKSDGCSSSVAARDVTDLYACPKSKADERRWSSSLMRCGGASMSWHWQLGQMQELGFPSMLFPEPGVLPVDK